MALFVQVFPHTYRSAHGHLSIAIDSLWHECRNESSEFSRDRRVCAYTSSRIESVSRDRTRLSSDGRQKSSFEIARYMQPVFPNRMSRRRGTYDANPLLLCRSLYQDPRVPFHVSPLFPFTCRCHTWFPAVVRAYVKPVGLVTSPLPPQYSLASVRHP